MLCAINNHEIRSYPASSYLPKGQSRAEDESTVDRKMNLPKIKDVETRGTCSFRGIEEIKCPLKHLQDSRIKQ